MTFAEKPMLYNISSRMVSKQVINLSDSSSSVYIIFIYSSTDSSALAVCNAWLYKTKIFQWSGWLLRLLFKVLSRQWSDFW